jgi:hypothetical protein
LKYVSPGGVLAIDPPGEIQHQLVKNAFQESKITRIVGMLVDAGACDRFERRARPPTRGPAGLRRQKPIRTRAVARLDVCTIPV